MFYPTIRVNSTCVTVASWPRRTIVSIYPLCLWPLTSASSPFLDFSVNSQLKIYSQFFSLFFAYWYFKITFKICFYLFMIWCISSNSKNCLSRLCIRCFRFPSCFLCCGFSIRVMFSLSVWIHYFHIFITILLSFLRTMVWFRIISLWSLLI